MSFAQPLWLIPGVIVSCCILLFFRFTAQKRRHALSQIAAPQLVAKLTSTLSVNKRRSKQGLIVLAVLLIFVSLARPQYGFKWVEVKRKGIDLLFALDTSKSMLAEDIRPNRLKRASLAILDFVNKLEGDRVGLMPFAGSAYLMCPLTTDYEAFTQSLQSVSTDIIPKGGTNLSEVIARADSLLSTSANHKILIILTDGENLQGDAIAAAEKAAQNGLTLYTVGVGTSSGELIPLTENGKRSFVKDTSGNFVTSKLDEDGLKQIATKTDGLYVPLGNGGQGLETIYQRKLALIPKEELAERRHKVPIERYEWPLAVALVLLVLELLTGERKNGRKLPTLGGRKFWKTTNSKVLIVLLGSAFALNLLPQAGLASPGEDAFAREDFLGASEYYSNQLEKSPEDPKLNYNYGTAAYRNNLYTEAASAFSKALASDDPQLQQKAYFNLGNSHYRKGLESLQSNPQQTLEEWQQAIDSYDASAQLSPPGEDSPKNNLDIVRKQLEELKKQQPPPQQQKKQDQNPDQNNNKDNEDKSSSQPQQNQQEESDQGNKENGQQQEQPGHEKSSADQNDPNKEMQSQDQNQSADAQAGEQNSDDKNGTGEGE